jgi:hypothetical protein
MALSSPDVVAAATARVIAACALAVGACGAPTCEDAVAHASDVLGMNGARHRDERAAMITSCRDEKWSANLRTCAKRATSRSALEACRWHAPRRPLTLDDYNKWKRAEAERTLTELRRRLERRHARKGAFPTGITRLTPLTSCCESIDSMCPPSPDEWHGADVWKQLDFAIDVPLSYQYSYASTDGQSAIVEAVGDLDCDGNTVTWTLHCTAARGDGTCTITKPDRAD